VKWRRRTPTTEVTGGQEYDKRIPTIPDGIIPFAELKDWAAEHEYGRNKRGTMRNNESFLYYKKRCLQIEVEEDVHAALGVARYMTAKGMLHPATRWGAFANQDMYHLFAVSPKLHSWSLSPTRTEQIERIEKPYTDESSAKLEWVRRLDSTAWVESVKPARPARSVTHIDAFDDFYGEARPVDVVRSRHPLAGLLNLHEASHSNNWGWDDNGTTYPVDVEVVDLNRDMNTVRTWHAERR
jgi:hypothetical protein